MSTEPVSAPTSAIQTNIDRLVAYLDEKNGGAIIQQVRNAIASRSISWPQEALDTLAIGFLKEDCFGALANIAYARSGALHGATNITVPAEWLDSLCHRVMRYHAIKITRLR